MARIDKTAQMFRVLSDETRLGILKLLKARALCVGALARRLGVSSSSVSQHLRVLREAGLVVAERRGNYMHYGAAPEALERWRERAAEILSPPAD